LTCCKGHIYDSSILDCTLVKSPHENKPQLNPLIQASAFVSPWIKYILFQIPGWFIAGAVVTALAYWNFIANWLAISGFVGWLFKDLLLYPFFRRAYEPGVTGSATLVGSGA